MGLAKEKEFIATYCASPTLRQIAYEEGIEYKPEGTGGSMSTKPIQKYKLEAGAGSAG